MAAKSKGQGEQTAESTSIQHTECKLEDVVQGAKAVHPQVMTKDVIELAKDIASGKRQLPSEESGLKMLILGKTGVGKSTLVNGLLGEKVAEVLLGKVATTGVTKDIEPHKGKVDKLNVIVYDSPGLQDGSGNDEKYLDMLHSTSKNVDIVIFAIKLEMRFVKNNPDAKAMATFTQKVGHSIWKKAIIVITFANFAMHYNSDSKQQDYKANKSYFQELMNSFEKAVRETLLEEAKLPHDIVESIKVIPAGRESEPRLLNGTLWFSNLWLECLKTVQTLEAQTYLIKANVSRLCTQKSIEEEDFKKPLQEQPIVLPDLGEDVKDSLTGLGTVGIVAIPASIGASIGAVGLVGGPIGAVAIPVGAFIGMIVGLTILAAKGAKKS